MPRDCPVCGLCCSDTAEACDCGYSFAHAGTVGRLQVSAAARRNMLVGGLIFFVSLSVTLLAVVSSTVTGFVFVAWGPILFGAFLFFRGWGQARRLRRLERERGVRPPG